MVKPSRENLSPHVSAASEATAPLTFLFTDIEGSTRLWELYPEQMHAALARHDAVLKGAIETHNGVVFKTMGDACCAVFQAMEDALAASVKAQQALQAQTWAGMEAIRVRMALHTGVARERNGDYYGLPLHRVARLLAIGYGGQVLVSDAAYRVGVDQLPAGAGFKDLGLHRLKDLQQPEHIWQLLLPGLPADFPPLRSLQASAANLPVQRTSFIGREQEMEEVRSLLQRTRLLTLIGAGGCGKTRLALQVAAELGEQYTEGVRLVELASLADPALVAQATASALGLREEPGKALLETLCDYLYSRRLLLLLDNCEHLLAACAELAETLLRACPDLCLLATSREALRLAGEQVYRVPSLMAPDPAHLPGEEKDLAAILLEYDACRLFLERAQLQKPDFALTTRNAPVVASVCHRLDGIPLALELAAARIGPLSVQEIHSRLDHRFRLLIGGSRTALPRHQTLQAALDWSYDLLTEPERWLLGRLSVFAGGWTLEAAEQVTGLDRLDLLTSLVEKSLVLAEEREGKSRYRLLETIREYAKEKLQQAGEEKPWRDRHLEFYSNLAEEATNGLKGAAQLEWLDRLEAEHDNLRAALEWSRSEADLAEKNVQLAGALWRFWEMRGHIHEGRSQLQRALEQGGAAEPTWARARALGGAGSLAQDQSDYEAARTLCEQSLAVSRALGDEKSLVDSLGCLGAVFIVLDDAEAARACFEECLTLSRKLGDAWSIATALLNAGLAAYALRDYKTARGLYEESLALHQELENTYGIATALGTLGNVAYIQGDYAAARRFQERSLAIRREMGDKRGIAAALNNLGITFCEQGDFETSRPLFEECLALKRELGQKYGVAGAISSLGLIAHKRGDLKTARTLYEESLALRRKYGDRWGTAYSLGCLSNLVEDLGDLRAARRLRQESMALYREIWATREMAKTLVAFGRLEMRENRPERAVRLWGAAKTAREGFHMVMTPVELEECGRYEAAARAALDTDAFATAWAEGEAMPIERAIEVAMWEPPG
ncbi:MAG TPA: tetratricopeptide repeat protein [Chthonomonadaceae bacterium]|nr:tetratricopeptide repeat protein [Chthonomonadaceae bacterium]